MIKFGLNQGIVTEDVVQLIVEQVSVVSEDLHRLVKWPGWPHPCNIRLAGFVNDYPLLKKLKVSHEIDESLSLLRLVDLFTQVHSLFKHLVHGLIQASNHYTIHST